MTPERLLQRYPHDSRVTPAELPAGSPERLRGVPDDAMRATLAAIFSRQSPRWEREREVRDFDFELPEPPAPGIPDEGPARDKWDRTNTLLLHEWTAMYAQISEYELQVNRKLSVHARNQLLRAFRARLARVYGATDIDPEWRIWDEERLRQKGKSR